jgi:hypothetical protein
MSFRESEVAAPAEASACRSAQGNSVQKQTLVEAVAKQVVDFEVERQSCGRDRIRQKNGIARSAELPSQQAAPEFGPIHSAAGSIGNVPQAPFGEIIAAAVPVWALVKSVEVNAAPKPAFAGPPGM